MDKLIEKEIKETISFIRSKTKLKPKIAIVLGSGLGDYANHLKVEATIDTSTIPHYPKSTVEGHKGKIIFGFLQNTKPKKSVPVLAFQGRVHYYETGDIRTVLFPILVAYKLGIKTLFLTNAAGGVNRHFHPGDLMLMKDHVNLTFENPTAIINGNKKINKPIYDEDLIKMIIKIAEKSNVPLREGVYVGVKGPSYETASEVEMVRRIGGDAVGMSTVNEATLASALGMRVAGISCITNYATGVTSAKLDHEEVTFVANMVKDRFSKLVSSIILSTNNL